MIALVYTVAGAYKIHEIQESSLNGTFYNGGLFNISSVLQ